FFFQAEDGIRDATVTGVQTCALPILILPNRAREPLLNFQTDCGTRPVSDKDLHRVATSCNYMRKVPQLCRIRSLKAVSAGLQGRVSLVFSVPLNKHGDCLRKPVSGRH